MTADDTLGDDLDGAIADVYRGPLEGFVHRRDALVKELRAAGRRADATAVKGLRKPNRTAWALDVAVREDPEAVERVAAAVAGVVEAQSGAGDLREAVERMRDAARDLALAGVRASAEAGHPVDRAVLSPAVMAVIGDAGALEALRDGRLATIPTTGGLAFLTGGAAPSVASAELAPKDVEPADADSEAAGAVVDARAALRSAEDAAATARERSLAAERTVRDAEVGVEAAEEERRRAEQQFQAVRTELAQARQQAKSARAELRQADKAAARARAKLEQLA